MRLQLCTWPDVDDYLNRCTGIVIPVGSTEQHGHDGVIGTDSICAESIALKAADLATADHSRILVAPTLTLSPAQFNLDFPGTISVRASTLMNVICDVVESLSRSGFNRFYFLNGHGANIPATRAALHDLHQLRSLSSEGAPAPLQFRLTSWWEFQETDALRKSFYGEREGMHATPSEISITRNVLNVPDTTPAVQDEDWRSLNPAFYRRHAQDSHDHAQSHRRQFPKGHVGSDPGLATSADGERLLGLAAREFYADWQDFMNQET